MSLIQYLKNWLSLVFLNAATYGPFAINPKSASLQSLINLNADNLTSEGMGSFC
jgi:hypothetical protein